MPLTAQFSSQCPLLIESDHLSLSSTFVLRAPLLYDRTIGAAHHVQPPGETIITALQAGITYHDLLRLAERRKLSSSALIDLIGFLNLAGALRCKRHARSTITILKSVTASWLTGVHVAPLSWRRPASPARLLIGLMRASWPVMAAAICVTALAVGGGLISLGTGLSVCTTGLLLFWISVYVHELAHLLILRKYQVRADILQRGLRLGLLHYQLEPTHELQSALAGPLLGIVCCALLCLACIRLQSPVVASVTVAVALVHVCSFLPWYGDGVSVRSALRHLGEA